MARVINLHRYISNANRRHKCHSSANEPEPLCDDQVVRGGVAALPDDPGSPLYSARPALPPPQWATRFVLLLIQVVDITTS